MRKLLLYSAISFCLTANVWAQAPLVPVDSNNLEVLLRVKYEKERRLAEEIAKAKNIQLRRELSDGTVIDFEGLDDYGKILFRKTDNVGAGRTTSTNKVWPGGTLGTSLTGNLSGNRLGMWDGGATRLTHQEFGGRAVQVDGAGTLSDHATHVAGTMIAAGVSTSVRGMAYQANLRAYDWFNDGSEMSSAGAGGMLVSNHSYGSICGWYNDGTEDIWYGEPSISATTDYKFGFYDSRAVEWDNIALSNPYMLICKSAGNDRGDNRESSGSWRYSDGTPGTGTAPGPDGGATGYDCVSTYGTAKNILTVGAVRKINNSNSNNGWTAVGDVVMSTFSGWGPTDDGRIKPDVVGCGVSVTSSGASSNTATFSSQGTSMSSPNVAGSLILVQQHYNNLKGVFMRSATLKALAIHTADEAGRPGPDYMYGWGLINTAKAVQTISDSSQNIIQERTIANGASNSQSVTSTGTVPLKVTIVWTERPGSPAPASLNPTKRMLVNDLDIRVRRVSDNTIFTPYILDPANPNNNATNGDNVLDNVEQIYLAAPQAGSYVVTVSHKGTLFGGQAQSYSIIISGVVGLPNANFGANNTVICTSNSVQFTDQSGGLPTQRVWYFPGGTPSTSTAVNPIVSYTSVGSFPVALRINNALGSDSIYVDNYITVGGLTLPFVETFNDNSPTRSRWTISNPNADTTWRLVDVPGNISGNKAYCMPFYNYSATGRRDRLDSPPLSLRGYTQPVLSFDHAYARYPQQASDSLVVWISTNCGSTWTRVFSRGENGTKNFSTVNDKDTEFYPADSSEWCSSNCISIPLTNYSGANNFRIRIEGYNNYGNNLFIDNIRITGSPIKPVVNFAAAKTNACTNEPIGFADLSTNFPTSWQWEAPGAIVSNPNIKNPIIQFPTVGTYTVKLIATNGAGTDSITKVNYIQVIQGPSVPNITSTGTMLCTGDSAILRTDSVADNYQWLKDGFAIQNQTTQTYTTHVTGLYRIRVSATNGCTLLSDTVRVMVNEKPAKPVLTSNLTNGQLCEGGTAVLTSNILDNNVWFKNNQIMTGVSGRQVNVSDGGTYKVQITEGGCSGDFSDPVTINLLPKPQTTDLVGPSGVKPASEHTYSVTGSSGSIYNWIVIGGQRTGSSNSISVVWGNGPTGNIQVRETATNGCQGDLKTMAITIGVNQSINENDDYFNQLNMYPVPASNTLFFTFESNTEVNAEVRLLNTLGQLMESKTWAWKVGENKTALNVSNIATGMYFVEIISEGHKTVRKIQIAN